LLATATATLDFLLVSPYAIVGSYVLVGATYRCAGCLCCCGSDAVALDEKTDRADFLVGDGGCLTTEANKLKAGGGSSFFLDAVDSFCSLGWCCFGKSCAVGIATVSSSDFISSFVSVVIFSLFFI
jgi:hypothetical protein